MKRTYLPILLYLIYALYILTPTISADGVLMLLYNGVALLMVILLPYRSLKLSVLLLYLGYCWFNPIAFMGLPLLYTVSLPFPLYLGFIGIAFFRLPFDQWLIVCALSVIQIFYLQAAKEAVDQANLKELFENQMTSIERQNKLEQQQLQQQQKQDLEISVLNERNRIARDIHDNVGHLLTRALLQVGALQAISPSPQHNLLRETLDQGMSAIRTSVHALYEQSEHLEHEINELLTHFPQLQFEFACHLVQEPKASIRALYLVVIKEALTNTIKHSQATSVTLNVDESAHHYYCIIQDNGSTKNPPNNPGMGLLSLEKRVKAENGILNIQPEQGYRIYMSIPKENQ